MKSAATIFCAVAVLSAAAGGQGAGQRAADAARRSLGRVSLRGVSAGRAIETLRDRSEAVIAVDWESLAEAGVERDDPVRIVGEELTLAEALYRFCGSLDHGDQPVSWLIFEDAFVVTTQDNVLAVMRGRGAPPIRAPRPRPAQATTRPDEPRRGERGEPASRGRISRLQLDDVALEDAIEFLRSAGRMDIVVNWTALEQTGVDRRAPVSVRAADVSLAKALDLVLDQVNAGRGIYDSVYWDVDESVVTITTGAELDRDMRVRVYDVSDLLMVVPDFPGRDLELTDDGGGSDRGGGSSGSSGLGGSSDGGLFGDDDDDEDDYDAAAQQAELAQQLVDVVKAASGEELWRPVGRGTVRIFRGRLIVSQTRLGFKLMEQNLRRR